MAKKSRKSGDEKSSASNKETTTGHFRGSEVKRGDKGTKEGEGGDKGTKGGEGGGKGTSSTGVRR